MDHDTQTQFAKKELEKAGKPMPLVYRDDYLSLPELDVEPHPALYRELHTIYAKVEAIRQGFTIHGAKVAGVPRYFTRRSLMRGAK